MKKTIAIFTLVFTFPLLFAGCTGNTNQTNTPSTDSKETEATEPLATTHTEESKKAEETEETKKASYLQISGEDAYLLMQSESDFAIIDARTEEEFSQGHIKNAILIPEYQIAEKAPSLLPNKDQLILVYCRSGRRSKIAAQALADLGYVNVKEFGGIIDWQYETVT